MPTEHVSARLWKRSEIKVNTDNDNFIEYEIVAQHAHKICPSVADKPRRSVVNKMKQVTKRWRAVEDKKCGKEFRFR